MIQESLEYLQRIDWLRSLVAAIPLSILGNLLVSPILNAIAAVSRETTEKRVRKLEDEIADAAQLRAVEHLLPYAFHKLFRVILYYSVAFVCLMLSYISSTTESSEPLYASLLGLLGLGMFFVGFSEAWKTCADMYWATNFENYQRRQGDSIRKLQAKLS